MEEKRKSPRINSFKLLSYVCLDEEGKPSEQGMGNTLDINLGGLLLETNVPIESQNILLQALNIREELIKFKGQVVYSREAEPKIFHTGISFKEKKERVREIVVDLIKRT